MNRAWLWVLLGGLMETVWAVGMKFSDGFTNIPYVILTLVFLFISMILLNHGLKSGLPIGPCYAVWVGTGAICSVIVSALFLGEAITPLGYVFLAMIIAGVLGLNLISGDEEPPGDD